MGNCTSCVEQRTQQGDLKPLTPKECHQKRCDAGSSDRAASTAATNPFVRSMSTLHCPNTTNGPSSLRNTAVDVREVGGNRGTTSVLQTTSGAPLHSPDATTGLHLLRSPPIASELQSRQPQHVPELLLGTPANSRDCSALELPHPKRVLLHFGDKIVPAAVPPRASESSLSFWMSSPPCASARNNDMVPQESGDGALGQYFMCTMAEQSNLVPLPDGTVGDASHSTSFGSAYPARFSIMPFASSVGTMTTDTTTAEKSHDMLPFRAALPHFECDAADRSRSQAVVSATTSGGAFAAPASSGTLISVEASAVTEGATAATAAALSSPTMSRSALSARR